MQEATQISTTGSQRSGLALLAIGALYMMLVGWMASWWAVPTIRLAGLDGLPGTAFFFFWQLSAPVGALLAMIGAAIVGRVRGQRLAAIIIGSLVVAIWLGVSMGLVKEVIPPLFGIGGGLISLAFVGMLWDWSRGRSALSRARQSGADLVMAGQVFYLIAAWYLCGLLGAPTFLLRPTLAMTNLPENVAISLGTTILLSLTFGSVLMYLGRRVALRDGS